MKDEVKGMVSMTAAVVLFSTIEITGKVIGLRVDPFLLTFVRFFITGLVLLALSISTLRLRKRRLTMSDWRFFALNGFVGITVAISLFHVAILQFQKAASAAVVFSVNPVFVLLFGRFINHEPWSIRKWMAILLGVGGVAFFAFESGNPATDSLVGLGLMLLSASLFAVSICLAKRKVADYGAMVLMGFSALLGSLFLVPLLIFRGEGLAGVAALRSAWMPVSYIVLCGTALAYWLYYFGLLNVSAQRGSMTFFLKPVLASVFAVLILDEAINGYMITGTGLILVGLVVGVMRKNRNLAEEINYE